MYTSGEEAQVGRLRLSYSASGTCIPRIAPGTPWASVDISIQKRIESVRYAGGLLMSQIRFNSESIQRMVARMGGMDGVAYIGGAFSGRSMATGTTTAGTSKRIRSTTRTGGMPTIRFCPATLFFLLRLVRGSFRYKTFAPTPNHSADIFYVFAKGCVLGI